MPSTVQQNPYRDTSWADAGNNLATAFFGDPKMKAAYAQLEAQRLNQAQQQSNWNQSFALQNAAAARDAELHPHALSKAQLEKDKLSAELSRIQAENQSQSGIVNFFKTPGNLVRDPASGRMVIPQDKVSEFMALQAQFDPQISSEAAKLANPEAANPVNPVIAGETVFWHPGDPRNPNFQSDPNSIIPEMPLPSASPQGGQISDTQAFFETPLQEDRAQQPFSTSNPNISIVPKNKDDGIFGTEKDRYKTVEDAQSAAFQSKSNAMSASRMAQDDAFLQKSQLGVGVPGVDSVISGIANLFDTEGAKAARQFSDTTILDWLQKSTLLKGAITERETAQLRASQPPPYASAQNKKEWLNAMSWASNREAEWQNIRAEAAKKGVQPPNVIEWTTQYEQKFPRPALLGGGNQMQSTPSVADAMLQQPSQTQAPTGVPAGISPSDWQYMTPEERALFTR